MRWNYDKMTKRLSVSVTYEHYHVGYKTAAFSKLAMKIYSIHSYFIDLLDRKFLV